MLRVIGCALLLAACASYRALPDLPLRYEQTRLLVFKSIKDDVLVERAFASGPRIVAIVSRPAEGVFASADGGATWAFSKLEPLREVLFDGERIIGRAQARLWRSEDGGRSWSAMDLQAGPIDALALGADRTVYAAASGRLFASADGRAFRAISLQIEPPFRIRSIAPDPAQASTLYVSVRADPPSDFLARLRALLDRTSEEALVALALVDRPDAPLRFGAARDGVYASYDRGGLWKKTPLGLDAWLVFAQGALHAVAADPLLEAAALSRRYPDLASALERQLHGDRADAAGLRAACRFPGREALLSQDAPVFRAAEAALSWRKLKEPIAPQLAVALRQSIERQRTAQGEWLASEAAAPPSSPIPAPPPPGGPAAGPPVRGRGGRVTRSGGPGPMRRAARIFSPETVLSLLDPTRLLSHFNGGLPLADVARQGEAVFAYVPSAAYWDLLAANMASASDSEGEISLGPGWVKPDEGGTRFELLRSDDGGASWSALPAPAPEAEAAARGVAPYPSSIAPALVVLSGREKEGDRWSALRRYLP